MMRYYSQAQGAFGVLIFNKEKMKILCHCVIVSVYIEGVVAAFQKRHI